MKTWGIWGLGSVGKSAIQYLHAKGNRLSVYDTRELLEDEKEFIERYQVTLYTRKESQQFFSDNDFILPSPGVDTSPARMYQHKLVSEVDLFCNNWHKPLIAVTGSLGKTTLVSIMDQLLKAHHSSCATGGNIGNPMLDLLPQQADADYALLELSSFQLENAQTCKPRLAVLTNIFPNHLDRHGSLDKYIEAKYQLFKHHEADQKSLIPFSMMKEFRKRTTAPLIYFSEKYPTPKQLAEIGAQDILYTFKGLTIHKLQYTTSRDKLIATEYTLAPTTLQHLKPFLPSTRLLVLAMCDQLNIAIEATTLIPKPLAIPEHRIECIGSYKSRSFYNDSKATIIDATIAAATTINEPIHLILGGLSKGVDRLTHLKKLKNRVATVHCFGAEAAQIQEQCLKLGLHATSHNVLDQSFLAAITASSENEAILFSPGGSSFDLYKNYKERGEHFKELVKNLSFNESGRRER